MQTRLRVAGRAPTDAGISSERAAGGRPETAASTGSSSAPGRSATSGRTAQSHGTRWRRRRCSLLVQGLRVKRRVRVVGVELLLAGDARARLVVWFVCARAPSLTSVRDPRVGSGAGDMMVDGVVPLGEALRPLGLLRPTTRAWRREHAGSRPRRIGVTKGCPRTGKLMRARAPPRRALTACGSCA
jgi:hypothetical protein